MLDAFNHCTSIESAKEVGQRGIYKLKEDCRKLKEKKMVSPISEENQSVKDMNEIDESVQIQRDYSFEMQNEMMTIDKELNVMMNYLVDQITYSKELINNYKQLSGSSQSSKSITLDLQYHRLSLLSESLSSYI